MDRTDSLNIPGHLSLLRSFSLRNLLMLCPLALAAAISTTFESGKAVVGKDSGVFLYVAQQILEGKVPYRDVWDHKPPAIYYLDAVGLLIDRQSLFGIWVIELASLFAAALLGFLLLRRALGGLPATVGSLMWLASAPLVLYGGNLTEEYALPLQFLALYMFFLNEEGTARRWRSFVLGLSLAGCFLLKPTLVGIQASIVAYIVVSRAASRQWRTLGVEVSGVLLGCLTPLLLTAAYFAAQGALDDLVDQVFLFNVFYSGGLALDLEIRLRAIAYGLWQMSKSGLSILALAGWVAAVSSLWAARGKLTSCQALVAVAVLDLPLEFALSAASGYKFPHYFLSWLPGMAVLTAFLGYVLMRGSLGYPGSDSKRSRSAPSSLLLAGLVLAACLPPVSKLVVEASGRSFQPTFSEDIALYIQQSTHNGDYVLMWGADSAYNFVAQRPAPTRFVYQYPLYVPGYQRSEMVREFLADLRVRKPALIIEALGTDPGWVDPWIPPIESHRRALWEKTSERLMLPETQEVFQFIASHYEVAGQVGQRGQAGQQWKVYRHREGRSEAVGG